MSTIFNSSKTAETVNRAIDNNMGTTTTEQGASSAGLIISEDLGYVVECTEGFDYHISEKNITGAPPLTFHAVAQFVTDWTLSGNTTVTGTPAPDNPSTITGVGDYDENDKCIIPITNGDTTINIDLSAVQSVRNIKKMVLTGNETWYTSGNYTGAVYAYHSNFPGIKPHTPIFCTHLVDAYNSSYVQGSCKNDSTSVGMWVFNTTTSPTAFKNYLANQYSDGTPVTIYYILAEPVTDTINEPLQKIGDYADIITGDLSETSIPLNWGYNTIDTDTTVTPSSMTINYKDD